MIYRLIVALYRVLVQRCFARRVRQELTRKQSTRRLIRHPFRNGVSIAVALLLITQVRVAAQTCNLTSGGCAISSDQWPTSTQSTTSSSFVTVNTQIEAGEWARYSVTAGNTYEWSLCSADGATVPYDATMTLRTDAVPGQMLRFSDDCPGCNISTGQAWAPKITWTATSTGTVRVQINRYVSATDSCGLNSTAIFATVRWRCATCTSTGNISATLKDQNGNNASANGTRFLLYTSPSQQISNTNPATFTNIPVGTYLLEGYHNGFTPFGEEFWQSQQVAVGSSPTLTRQYPYAYQVEIRQNNSSGPIVTSGQSIPAGTTIWAGVSVRNSVPSTPLNCQVRLVFDNNQTGSYLFDQSSSFQSISGSGGTRVYAFTYSPTTPGQQFVALEVLTSANGRTDSWPWNTTFNLQPPVFAPYFFDATTNTGLVDLDGDGYRRQFEIGFDVDSNIAGNFYVRIYEDDLAGDDFLVQSATFAVNGTPQDFHYVTIVTDTYNLFHGTSEYKLELYNAANNSLVETWTASDDSDLESVLVELSSEDVVTQPDLVVTDILMESQSGLPNVYPGQDVRLDFTVLNQGNATTQANVHMRWYWGTSANAQTNFIAEGNLGEINGLSPGREEGETDASWIIPQLSPGTYWITARIDWDNLVSESNENNNVRSESFVVLAPAQADLVVTDILMESQSGLPNVYPGQDVRLDFTVLNQGNATTQANVHMRWYWGTSANAQTNFIAEGNLGEINGLSPGREEGETDASWIIPQLSPGTYWITARIDWDNLVSESNENNNVRSESFVVLAPAQADLVVTDILMESQSGLPNVYPGQDVRLDFTVLNQGNATTQANVHMRWYWGTSANAQTNFIAEGNLGEINGLSPGREEGETDASWIIPQLSPGTYWITARIDWDNLVSESNENNNVRSESFVVLAPAQADLVVTDILMESQSGLPNVYPGQDVRLDFTVLNQGNATTQANVHMRWYWGTSANAQTNFIAEGNLGEINGLSPGREEGETDASWIIPQLSPGTYWITARIDWDGLVNESDEDNNLRSESFVVLQGVTNDFCTSATVITSNVYSPALLNTVPAQTTSEDPSSVCEAGALGVSNTVWYSFTPTQAGLINAHTVGTNYDTVLTVFSGNCESANVLACSDNTNYGNTSEISSVALQQNQTCLIKVGDALFLPNGGNLDFNAQFIPFSSDQTGKWTLITHGFQPFLSPSVPGWVYDMADAIVARAGGIGTVLKYSKVSGKWEPVPEHPAALDPSKVVVLIFDWAMESNGCNSGGSAGTAEAAAEALYASLRDPSYLPLQLQSVDFLGTTGISRFHMIGHSRGAVVNSEVVQRLGLAGLEVARVTSIDPHPVALGEAWLKCGGFDGPDPQPYTWTNVIYADNYWQDDDYPAGQQVTGAYNYSELGAILGSAQTPLWNEHFLIHEWYRGTIDLSYEPGLVAFADRMDWYGPDLGWQEVYYWSVLGGASGPTMNLGTKTNPMDSTAGPVLTNCFNGNFQLGINQLAGWGEHGGESDNLNWTQDATGLFMRLPIPNGLGFNSRTHNRVWIDPAFETLAFDHRVNHSSPAETLRIRFVNELGQEFEVYDGLFPATTSDWEPIYVPIPTQYHSNSYAIQFDIDAVFGQPDLEIDIDNIRFVPCLAPDSHLTVVAEVSSICTQGATTIRVLNSQLGVSYQLRNHANNQAVGVLVAGNGGSLGLPTGALMADTTFNVLATTTACGQVQLNQVATVAVFPSRTVTIEGPTAVPCNQSAILTASSSGGVGTCTYQWQQSTNGCAGPWTNIPGAMAASLDTGPITTNVCFRAAYSCAGGGCNTATSICHCINCADDILEVPSEFATIQAAITAATNGQQIVVAPGNYAERINLLGKAIVLSSLSGPNTTVIDGGGGGTVVTCSSGESNSTVIDGFTITGGNAVSGGGMFIANSSPRVVNCKFVGNTGQDGGAINANPGGQPEIIGCIFSANSASAGGGIVVFEFATITNCQFIGNNAANGGALFNSWNSSVLVSGCQFQDNAAGWGAAVLNAQQGSFAFTDCRFSQNTAEHFGGAMYSFDGGNPSIAGSVFCANAPDHITGGWVDNGKNCFASLCTDANQNGLPDECDRNDEILDVPSEFSTIMAAIASWQPGSVIRVGPGTYPEYLNFGSNNIVLKSANGPASTILTGSTSVGGSGSIIVMDGGQTSAALVEGFTITGGFAERGGGIQIINSSPTIRSCIIQNNVANGAGGGGGGIFVQNGSPRIEKCQILSNQATSGGGMNFLGSEALIQDCIIKNNTSNFGGGFAGGDGVLFCDVTLVNCLIANNHAQLLNGAMSVFGKPFLKNCTVVGNTAPHAGGLSIAFTDGILHLHNCIVWANSDTDATTSTEFSNLRVLDPAVVDAQHSIVEGWTGVHGGAGNIGTHPRFLDYRGPDGIDWSGDENLRLSTSSCAVNTGNNALVPAGISFDVVGSLRIAGGIVDRGAYEFQGVSCDQDIWPIGGNGMVNIDDLVMVITNWHSEGTIGDVTCNNWVDIDDVVAVITGWGMCH